MAKDIETIIALTNALYNASTRTSQAASRKSELEAERNNVQKQSTESNARYALNMALNGN